MPTVPPVRADHAAKLRVFDALLREAVGLGALPLRNPLQDLETDIALAAAINAVGR